MDQHFLFSRSPEAQAFLKTERGEGVSVERWGEGVCGEIVKDVGGGANKTGCMCARQHTLCLFFSGENCYLF